MTNESKRERIEGEASLWAARLDGGGLTDADRDALAVWLEADPEHRWVLSQYRQLSSQIDAHFSARRPHRERQRRRWLVLLPALAAAAAIVLLFSLLVGRSQGIETKTGERHLATLEDGSRVELNALTSLSVAFRAGERHVRLARGEALFTVAKDAARPFVVETPAGTVRVTGTVFNVRAAERAHDARVEVTVLEGRVQVHADDGGAVDTALAPDTQAVLAAGSVAVRSLGQAGAQAVVAWRQGQAVFEDTPLAEVVERFAAYHARAITVDPGAADLRLGGRYSLDDLDGLFDAVERVLPARVLRAPGGAVRIVATGAQPR